VSDVTRYPLCWPAGRPREKSRSRSRFKVASFTRVRDELLNELKLLRAQRVILSTNLRLRQDGLPLAGQSQPADTGVAVYFTRNRREVCFACDRWHKIEDNMQAIRHTIEALRGVERWGTGDMVEAAFAGFAQLPVHTPPAPWYVVLGVPSHASTEQVNDKYRTLAKQHHPDRGGDEAKAKEINAAYEAFKRERGL
jgi:hypothetical protein